MHDGQLHNTARTNPNRQQISRNLKQVVIQIHQSRHRLLDISHSQRILPCLALLIVHIIIIIITSHSFFDCLADDRFFYNKKFQNRMKRSASSSKENMMKGCFSKKSSRQERPYQEQIKLMCTQTIVSEYPRQTLPWQTPDFYKTFAHNQVTEGSRPQSKQAFRKCSGRPQTSKGVRPSEKSLKIWQHESKMGYHSHYVAQRKQHQQGESEPGVSNIEIIVTQSNRKCGEKKEARSKFQTDLDDEFLQLFAN